MIYLSYFSISDINSMWYWQVLCSTCVEVIGIGILKLRFVLYLGATTGAKLIYENTSSEIPKLLDCSYYTIIFSVNVLTLWRAHYATELLVETTTAFQIWAHNFKHAWKYRGIGGGSKTPLGHFFERLRLNECLSHARAAIWLWTGFVCNWKIGAKIKTVGDTTCSTIKNFSAWRVLCCKSHGAESN